MKLSPALINHRRLARIILWAQTILVWVALTMFSPKSHADRRRIRQRYHFLSLDWLRRLVGVLIFVRAVEIVRPTGRAGSSSRDPSPKGFRRRLRLHGMMRASLGSRLRAALRHRDPRERIMLLLAAIADLDGFARRYLVRRVMRRFNKLRAIVIAAPQVCALVCQSIRAPVAADSS